MFKTKYRILKRTMINGDIRYFPQYKKWFIWEDINRNCDRGIKRYEDAVEKLNNFRYPKTSESFEYYERYGYTFRYAIKEYIGEPNKTEYSLNVKDINGENYQTICKTTCPLTKQLIDDIIDDYGFETIKDEEVIHV